MPFLRRREEFNRKVMWVLFNCLTVRFFHLETVPRLQPISCIMIKQQHITGKGTSFVIWSDNGAIFNGVETLNYLKEFGSGSNKDPIFCSRKNSQDGYRK